MAIEVKYRKNMLSKEACERLILDYNDRVPEEIILRRYKIARPTMFRILKRWKNREGTT